MKKKEIVQEIEKEYQFCGKQLWCVHKKVRTSKEKIQNKLPTANSK